MSVIDSVKENMRNSLHRTESEKNEGKTQLPQFNRIRARINLNTHPIDYAVGCVFFS